MSAWVRVLGVVAVAVSIIGAAFAVTVELIFGDRDLGLLIFSVWLALPFLVLVLLVRAGGPRNPVSRVVITVGALAVAGYGTASMLGYARSPDGLAGLVVLFLPAVQLAAALVCGLVLVVELLMRRRRRPDGDPTSATRDPTSAP